MMHNANMSRQQTTGTWSPSDGGDHDLLLNLIEEDVQLKLERSLTTNVAAKLKRHPACDCVMQHNAIVTDSHHAQHTPP